MRKPIVPFVVVLCLLSGTCPPVTGQERPSVADTVYEAIGRSGIERAVATYRHLRRTAADDWDFSPAALNRLGYRLLGEGRLEAAVRIFALNTEVYPLVANGYDSLGEGYLWLGEYAEAVAAYRRVLEVAPRDTVASPGLIRRLTERATEVTTAYERIRSGDAVMVRSPRLQALEEEVARRGADAVRAFRAERERAGGPLVEPVAGDSLNRLVTFLWFESDEPVEHVVVQSWLDARSVERRAMQRLPGTSLWFRTWRVPAGLRMGYLLSPDDRRLSPYAALATGAMVEASWTPDPLNPARERGAMNLVWSVLELPGAASAPWLDSDVRVPEERLAEFEIASAHLEQPWEVVVYTPPGFAEMPDATYPLLVFFDGFGFANIDRVHVLLETMIVQGALRPVVAAFVYNPGTTRLRDMSCHPPVHAFLRDDLIPRLRRAYRSGQDPAETVLVGRSRSGLGAVCAAFHLPEVFGNALAQSGSFWWGPGGEETEWLARAMAEQPRRPVVLYLEAGLLEEESNPETGLSMLTVTRHLRDVARAKGYRIHYQELAGGHDPLAWRTTLPQAFETLLGRPE